MLQVYEHAFRVLKGEGYGTIDQNRQQPPTGTEKLCEARCAAYANVWVRANSPPSRRWLVPHDPTSWRDARSFLQARRVDDGTEPTQPHQSRS